MRQGNYLKFLPEQWMHRVSDFNLSWLFCQWVVEGGINKGFSYTKSCLDTTRKSCVKAGGRWQKGLSLIPTHYPKVYFGNRI